ncbi:MAG: hypothetical protein GEU73_03650 [Chloroflexi bacterium]|nr:hypothetical protein [Chloroflexota bacterium]
MGISPLTYVKSVGVGLGLSVLGGVVLTVAPVGALVVLPLVLTGLLVGEAMSAVAGRQSSSGLALLAFMCATVGPLIARAALVATMLPSADPVARANASFGLAIQSLGPFTLFLLVLAGVIATTRVSRR